MFTPEIPCPSTGVRTSKKFAFLPIIVAVAVVVLLYLTITTGVNFNGDEDPDTAYQGFNLSDGGNTADGYNKSDKQLDLLLNVTSEKRNSLVNTTNNATIIIKIK